MREHGSWPMTRLTLLTRLRDSHNAAAWTRFIDVYGPLIYRYCRRRGAQDADAAEVTQDVLIQVWKSIPTFQYEPSRGRFRSWLGTVTRNRLIRQWRNTADDGKQTVDPAQLAGRASASSWDDEATRHVLLMAMERVRPFVEVGTWRAFELAWVEDRPATEVAQQLGVPVDRVYVAKSRVLKRLEAEVKSLADDLPVVDG